MICIMTENAMQYSYPPFLQENPPRRISLLNPEMESQEHYPGRPLFPRLWLINGDKAGSFRLHRDNLIGPCHPGIPRFPHSLMI